MTNRGPTPPLTRRVPGASGSGPGKSARTLLPDAVLQRMQAAVEAARAADAADADDADEPDLLGPPAPADLGTPRDGPGLAAFRPGMHRLIGVHVLDVALGHQPQRLMPA